MTGKIVHDQVLSFDIEASVTVSSIYDAVKQFMVKLLEEDHLDPLMLQFDTLDP